MAVLAGRLALERWLADEPNRLFAFGQLASF